MLRAKPGSISSKEKKVLEDNMVAENRLNELKRNRKNGEFVFYGTEICF